MKREDAEKMANDIFDMIDSNHPRGLVKSELVDLLCKYDTGSPAASVSAWPPAGFVKTDEEKLKKADYMSALTSLATGFEFTAKTDEQIQKDKETLRSLGYYFPRDAVNHYFTKDPCDND